MLHLVDDWDSFLQRVRHMPNNKQPGPDDIPNELLKILPESTLRTIHKLIVIMWITGHTPSEWTESWTVELPKEGKDPTDPKGGYRPVGLVNSL